MSLTFFYGTMSAGKSAALLKQADDLKSRGEEFVVYTSALDDRCGYGWVSSRNGQGVVAQMFSKTSSFFVEQNMLIDEAQFLTAAQVAELSKMSARYKTNIYCFGLRTDFRGKLFEGSAALMAVADELIELPGRCGCGSKSAFNMRIDSHGNRVTKGEQVLIGGNDRYRAVCASCYYESELVAA